jgi:hypothetical protein
VPGLFDDLHTAVCPRVDDLAIVLLNSPPTSPPVGQATPSASAQPSEALPSPTAAPPSSAPTEAPSAVATPVETPIPSPEPDVFLALTGSVEDPQLEERRAQARRRLEVYRQRLRTLRSARDYINLMREGKQGERLENVRQAFEQMQAPVAEA